MTASSWAGSARTSSAVLTCSSCRRAYAHTVYLSVQHSTTLLGVHKPEAAVRIFDLSLGLRRQLCLRRPGMRVGADRQAEYRCGVLERTAPVGEVIGTPRVAGPPRPDVQVELVHPGFTPII